MCAAHELPTQAHAAATHLRNYVDTSAAAVNLSTATFTLKILGQDHCDVVTTRNSLKYHTDFLLENLGGNVPFKKQ